MSKSSALFQEAKKVIPGGVNSPVRAFKSVGLDPIFIESAKGSKIKDVDGNIYTDFICSWGPLILGHSPEVVLTNLMDVINRGTSYGVPSPLEIDMAKAICDAYPSIDKVRMVNSGTEATMSALRVARAYTNKNKIIKFEGCYHGHSDALLVKSGSGTLTFGVPTSPGVPADVVKDTIVCDYNDIDSVKKAIESNKDEVACVILEPIAGNMGVVVPEMTFVKELRQLCTDEGIVLIFDEVITGFRVAYGGAQEAFGIEADMTCLGKIIGGGLPVGAYGGKEEIMSMVSPVGPVYQAGTLSGNPLAMHMGLKTLEHLKANPNIYAHMETLAIRMQEGLDKIISDLELPIQTNRYKGMLCLFFTKGDLKSYKDVAKSDTEKYAQFFRLMLEKGYLLPPAQFEGYFFSEAHTEEDVDGFLISAKEALNEMYK